jgi:ankyrin repeat protein
MQVDGRLRHDGETGLHWAAYEGNGDIVRLLLDRGARVDLKDQSYGGTPLGWALYGWGAEERHGGTRYYEVVALLARAGAKLDPDWYEEDGDRQRAVKKLQSDPRMLAALKGELLS